MTGFWRRWSAERCLQVVGSALLGLAVVLVLTDTPLDAVIREFFYPMLTGSTEAKPALLLAHLGLVCLLLARGRVPVSIEDRVVGAVAAFVPPLPYVGQLAIQLHTPYRLKAGTLVVVTGGGSVGETTSLTHTHALKACVGKVLRWALGHVRTKYHYGSVLAKYVPWHLAVVLTLVTGLAYLVLALLHPLSVRARRGTVLEPLLLSLAGFLTVLGAVDGGFMCKPLVIGLGLYLVWALGPVTGGWPGFLGAVVAGLTPMLIQAVIRSLCYLAAPVAPNSVAWAVGLSALMALAVSRGL
ncbi:MAG: hypothetical protein ABGY09_02610 [Euryarchaeota archaeon]